MSSSEARSAQSFVVRTAGNLLGRGTRTVTVTADGLVVEPDRHLAWSDFAGYRGAQPNTLIHRDGRKLTIAQARNNAGSIAEMRACLDAIAQSIDAYNASHDPATHLGPDIEGEYRATRRQRAGMIAVAILAAVLSVIAWTVPAPIPTVARFLPLTIVLVGAVYAATLNRRLRALQAQRRQASARG